MVVLNIYGKIKNPICISKKLGLYIANLPEEEHNNWNDMLYEEMISCSPHSWPTDSDSE